MTNAREEFIDHIGKRVLNCAEIRKYKTNIYSHIAVLPLGFTKKQYRAFLEALDFSYHAGFGGQELFGTIWYKDGTWSERGEYDGSEWWEYKQRPDIPTECMPISSGQTEGKT